MISYKLNCQVGCDNYPIGAEVIEAQGSAAICPWSSAKEAREHMCEDPQAAGPPFHTGSPVAPRLTLTTLVEENFLKVCTNVKHLACYIVY